MIRILFTFIFDLAGWKVRGEIPSDLKRYIFAVGPHTSNWDFILGLFARKKLCLRNAKFLGKSSLFRFPYGWFFRLMGGIPVDRKNKQDTTTQIAETINRHKYFIIALAPEGTRRKVDKLRTGFYYIAKKADIPIIACGLDYSNKEVVVGTPLYPGDNIDKDMAVLISFYKKIKGKNPELGL
jgi:1-acyl-sn-glycerol-3-phosphate acyltransferase